MVLFIDWSQKRFMHLFNKNISFLKSEQSFSEPGHKKQGVHTPGRPYVYVLYTLCQGALVQHICAACRWFSMQMVSLAVPLFFGSDLVAAFQFASCPQEGYPLRGWCSLLRSQQLVGQKASLWSCKNPATLVATGAFLTRLLCPWSGKH